jgi:hypothetical protein
LPKAAEPGYYGPIMTTIRIHGPIFLLMLALAFAAFGFIMGTELWDGTDAQIIMDAHDLSHDPSPMFGHIGFYFSQPVLQLAFLAEYRLFGMDMAGYMVVNLFVHAVNAFIVYMLVNMLFPHRNMAIFAAVLFVLGVGSYGRVLTSLNQLESLLLACLHLLVLYFFIRNDHRHVGKVWSPLFALGLFLFLLTGLTKAASFSLLGCLIAYKVFFYRKRQGRSILSPDILIFMGVGILFHLARNKWGYQHPTVYEDTTPPLQFTLLSFKNIFRYLNLMFFPIQKSPILQIAPGWVHFIFDITPIIRVFLTLAIISYSFFGFVFGSRAIRFFIAWTYITLLPFTGHTASGQWLNLSHLYLTSLGFCVILAAGADGTSRLLARRRWRRFLPYLVPLFLAAGSIGLTHLLDQQHKRRAATPEAVEMRKSVIRACQKRPVRFEQVR